MPLKGAVDVAVIPAAQKAVIRDSIAALTKRCLDAAKAAAAANKAAAADAAMAAADTAVEGGKGYVVLQLQVGTDSKAVSDAWAQVEKKHGDKLAGLFVSVDAEKGRALAYAGGCDTQRWHHHVFAWVEGGCLHAKVTSGNTTGVLSEWSMLGLVTQVLCSDAS